MLIFFWTSLKCIACVNLDENWRTYRFFNDRSFVSLKFDGCFILDLSVTPWIDLLTARTLLPDVMFFGTLVMCNGRLKWTYPVSIRSSAKNLLMHKISQEGKQQVKVASTFHTIWRCPAGASTCKQKGKQTLRQFYPSIEHPYKRQHTLPPHRPTDFSHAEQPDYYDAVRRRRLLSFQRLSNTQFFRALSDVCSLFFLSRVALPLSP